MIRLFSPNIYTQKHMVFFRKTKKFSPISCHSIKNKMVNKHCINVRKLSAVFNFLLTLDVVFFLSFFLFWFGWGRKSGTQVSSPDPARCSNRPLSRGAMLSLRRMLCFCTASLAQTRIQCEACRAKKKAFYSPESQHGRRVTKVY